MIHREYIQQGAEIHIDMYDDRVEITSPGGMVEGGNIQNKDIVEITSARRNPVIADLFHRMKFMERRGSGLQKIIDETAKLPGYTEELMPKFLSSDSTFKVVLMNVNYKDNEKNDGLSSVKSSVKGGKKLNKSQKKILELLKENPEFTLDTLVKPVGISQRAIEKNIKALRENGYLEREGSRKEGIWIVKN